MRRCAFCLVSCCCACTSCGIHFSQNASQLGFAIDSSDFCRPEEASLFPYLVRATYGTASDSIL